MLSPKQLSCLCFDSSYVLAEVFENQDAKTRLGVISQYQKKLKLEIYLPPTVLDECNNRMSMIADFIANLIREFERYFRSKKTKSKYPKRITYEDTKFVNDFFTIAVSKHGKQESERDIIKHVEALIVAYMIEALHDKKYGDYYEMFTGMMVNFLKYGNFLRNNMQDFLKIILLITAKVDTKLFDKIKNSQELGEIAQRKPNDMMIVCEVNAHQKAINKWSILVTLDHVDMLSHAKDIEKLTNVKCVDPLYVPTVVNSLSSRPT